MPFVGIDLPAGKPAMFRTAVGEAVQNAPNEALGLPETERFQMIAEHLRSAMSDIMFVLQVFG